MGNCSSCGGDCSQCSGCGNTLTLTDGEIRMLQKFAQCPFLPVARNAGDEEPVYLEESDAPYSLILACLEKKGLIDIDYHEPLRGFSYETYKGYALHGSMALTARGQSVLDLLDLQGVTPDV